VAAARSRARGRRASAPKPEAAKGERRPVWKEVEERESRKVGNRVRQRRRTHRRLAVVYDIDGPRVRLGMLWFFIACVALLFGSLALAVVYGVVAATAAAQTATAFRKVGRPASREVAALAAVALPLAAVVTTGLMGLAILVAVGATVFVAAGSAAASRRRIAPVVTAGLTVRCWLFVGLAAGSVVISDRFAIGGGIGLVLLVSAYETGDFIIGSGARNPYEGPVAGAAAILVVTFAITALGIEPFTFPGSFALGAMAAVLCPMGQLFGSAVLPSVTARAPALRRLDSLLVLGPAWAFAVGMLSR
jgi:hypothetical protein